MKIKCLNCEKEIGSNGFYTHIQKEHSNLTEIEKIFLYQNSIPNDATTKVKYLVDNFIDYLFKNLTNTFEQYFKDIRWYVRSYNPFCETMMQYRDLKIEDIELFFTDYLDYRKTNTKDVTSFKLAMIYCRNNEIEAKQFYDKVIKPRNGYTGHGGELSPWSKEFVGYKGLTDEEKMHNIHMNGFCKERPDYEEKLKKNNACTIDYYLARGYTQLEAESKLKERQTTFSLEKCIEKYGEEKGREIFNKRQKKWLDHFDKNNYSQISQNLFWVLQNKFPNLIMNFATNDNGIKVAHKNLEYKCKLDISYACLDFYIPSLNKWIEFDGDYWHGEARGNQERDRKREEAIKAAMPGIQLKRVKERDYNKDPNKVITECVDWINGK